MRERARVVCLTVIVWLGKCEPKPGVCKSPAHHTLGLQRFPTTMLVRRAARLMRPVVACSTVSLRSMAFASAAWMQSVGEVLAGAKKIEDFSKSELEGMVSQFSAIDTASTANCGALASCLAGLGPLAPAMLVENGALHALVSGIRAVAVAEPPGAEGIRHRLALLAAIISFNPRSAVAPSSQPDVMDALSQDDELLSLLADIVASDAGSVEPRVALQAATVLALAASQPGQVRRIATLSRTESYIPKLRSEASSMRLAGWVEEVLSGSRGSNSPERSTQLSASVILLHLATADQSDEPGETNTAAAAARQVLLTDDAFARIVDSLLDAPETETGLHIEAVRHLSSAVVDATIRQAVEGTPSSCSVRFGDIHRAMIRLSRLLEGEEPEIASLVSKPGASIPWKDREAPSRVAAARRVLAAFRNCCFALAVTSPLSSPMPVSWETHKEHLPAMVRVLGHPLMPHVFGAQILVTGAAGRSEANLVPLPGGHWAGVAMLRPVSRSAEDFAKLVAVPGAAAAIGNLLQVQAEFLNLATHALKSSESAEAGRFGALVEQADLITGLLGQPAELEGQAPGPMEEDSFGDLVGGIMLSDLGNMLASAVQADKDLAVELWSKRGGERTIPALTVASLALQDVLGSDMAGGPPAFMGYTHATQEILQHADLTAWEPREPGVLESTVFALRSLSVSPPRDQRALDVAVSDVLGTLQSVAAHHPSGAAAVLPSLLPATRLLERVAEGGVPIDAAAPVYLVRWLAALLDVLGDGSQQGTAAAAARLIASTHAAAAAVAVLGAVTTPGSKFESEAEQPLRLLAAVWAHLAEAAETSPEAALAAVQWSRDALLSKTLLSPGETESAPTASGGEVVAAATAARGVERGILGLFSQYDVVNGDAAGTNLIVRVLFWLQEAGLLEPELLKEVLSLGGLATRISALLRPDNTGMLAELVLVATRLLVVAREHPAVGMAVSEGTSVKSLMTPLLAILADSADEDAATRGGLLFMRALAPLATQLLLAVRQHGAPGSQGQEELRLNAGIIISLCSATEHNKLPQLLESAKMDDGSFDSDKVSVLHSLLQLLRVLAEEDKELAMSMLGAGIGDTAEALAADLRAEVSRTLKPARLFTMSASLQQMAPSAGSKNLLGVDVEATAKEADALAAIIDDA